MNDMKAQAIGQLGAAILFVLAMPFLTVAFFVFYHPRRNMILFALAFTVGFVAHAYALLPDSLKEFNGYYDQAAEEMALRGVDVKTTCFVNRCESVMSDEIEPGQWAAVLDLRFKDGLSLREVCAGDLKNRICSFSDGRTVTQRNGKDGWSITSTLSWRFSH
jgi:hypothetical protein